jgi:hypothetical protein
LCKVKVLDIFVLNLKREDIDTEKHATTGNFGCLNKKQPIFPVGV